MIITREQAIQIAGSEEELKELQAKAERQRHPELARLTGGVAKLLYRRASHGADEYIQYILSDNEEYILGLLGAGKKGLLCGRKVM